VGSLACSYCVWANREVSILQPDCLLLAVSHMVHVRSRTVYTGACVRATRECSSASMQYILVMNYLSTAPPSALFAQAAGSRRARQLCVNAVDLKHKCPCLDTRPQACTHMLFVLMIGHAHLQLNLFRETLQRSRGFVLIKCAARTVPPMHNTKPNRVPETATALQEAPCWCIEYCTHAAEK
jgi:hypothetical protein